MGRSNRRRSAERTTRNAARQLASKLEAGVSSSLKPLGFRLETWGLAGRIAEQTANGGRKASWASPAKDLRLTAILARDAAKRDGTSLSRAMRERAAEVEAIIASRK